MSAASVSYLSQNLYYLFCSAKPVTLWSTTFYLNIKRRRHARCIGLVYICFCQVFQRLTFTLWETLSKPLYLQWELNLCGTSGSSQTSTIPVVKYLSHTWDMSIVITHYKPNHSWVYYSTTASHGTGTVSPFRLQLVTRQNGF